jgi:glucan phosphorylase
MNQLTQARVASFSMEVALASHIPTYSGGLGVLAGDMLRAAADLRVPMVGVTLVHRQGYLDQELGADGNQTERPAPWAPDAWATELPARVSVELEGRQVQVRAYQYDVKGASGGVVSVLLLDTDLPENSEADRRLTGELYGGDGCYRLMQEAVLGIGGVRLLRALGCSSLERFHMNEGHAALLALDGVPSLSILDGWWLEGHVEGVTGRAIGSRSQARTGPDGVLDAENLYEQLERVILPLYYERPDEYLDVMRHAMALTGSFFNTHRMLQQYLTRAYFL